MNKHQSAASLQIPSVVTAVAGDKSHTARNIFNPHSAGIDFSRQNLTSVDVRFWRLKSIPTL